jgi:hypothetical protein
MRFKFERGKNPVIEKKFITRHDKNTWWKGSIAYNLSKHRVVSIPLILGL